MRCLIGRLNLHSQLRVWVEPRAEAGPRIGWTSAAGRAGIFRTSCNLHIQRPETTRRGGRLVLPGAAFKFKLVGSTSLPRLLAVLYVN